MTLPPEVLVELEGLLERATAGPWIATDRKTGAARIDVLALDAVNVKEASHVARCGGRPPARPMLSELDGIYEGNRIAAEGEANAALIAAAVNNLPALISTARSTEAMRAENERLTFANGDLAITALQYQDKMRAAVRESDDLVCKLEAAEAKLKAAREALEEIVSARVGNPKGEYGRGLTDGFIFTANIARCGLGLSTITPTGDADHSSLGASAPARGSPPVCTTSGGGQ